MTNVSSRLAALTALLLVSVTAGLGSAQPAALEAASQPERPHILIFLADDLGWKDVSYHGSEIRTPHIDRIAQEGIELDHFYVQPTCSPTRTALMTGKSPLRLGVTRPVAKHDEEGLPIDEVLLPEQLGRLGYQSVMTGKWHLGHYTPDQFPNARGFESFKGHVTGGIGYWDHVHGGGYDWQRDGVTLREEGYSTHLIADEAVRLVETRDEERPLFLYVAFNAPHLPNEAPLEALDRYAGIADINRRTHAGMIDEMDRSIGRVLAAFEAQGLLENTIVLFSSDNGGIVSGAVAPAPLKIATLIRDIFGRPAPFASLEFLVANVFDGGSDNGPLRMGKMSVFEGGARVPAAIWWPGRLEGRRHDSFMTMSDVLPTLLDAVGAADATPRDLNGRSQWAALSGAAPAGDFADYVISGFEGDALYRAPLKLINTDPPQLYDIMADPYEEKDLAAEQPGRVAEMVEALATWPIGERNTAGPLSMILDPDAFGGEEDRAPWADVARENAENP